MSTWIRKVAIRAVFLSCCFLLTGVVVDGWVPGGVIIEDAEARVGRPATPGSVAGVARRSTRRAIRRTSVYVATLPTSCTKVDVDGTELYLCGTTYYQSVDGQYVVVKIE